MELENRLKVYYVMAIFSMFFALLGFTYNAWRMEVSEDNNTIRTASFEVLKVLAETQQLIYAAHYDQNEIEGDPRKGWVKIGLIVDLSFLINQSVERRAQQLRQAWQDNWGIMADDRHATNKLINEIEQVRSEIKSTLIALD